MKVKILIFITLLSVSSASSAAMVWTDGAAFGPGKEVDAVYPQFASKWLIFRTTDGKYYSYRWGESEQMTENAKAIMSLLLTAISTKKRVSFYYDDSINSYTPISLINIHD
ncbi:hypothetical protein FKG94_17855 [Exilibacterium tricleocarpae]|uniref:Uncharacterized protein n=1 Tax=Exilibacterium tricleocarpae TaxID=2591008 RepID=A0A545T5P7_9GAMM|nr:hypothetical protein [Exilibacterium tricleocarpae]TQV72567.1 hypothetical protein FKG94_17855 [Exilibacterium tricleocarpae]